MSLGRLRREMKTMPVQMGEVRTRNPGKADYQKSQACWAVRQRIRCTKMEGNARSWAEASEIKHKRHRCMQGGR